MSCSVTPKYGKTLRRYLVQSPDSTHNFNFESGFGAVNCSSPPPPLASWSCWEVKAISEDELRNILKSDPAWKKGGDYPMIHITDIGFKAGGRGREGALADHLESKPYLEVLLQCLTFLAATESFLVSHLNNSHRNFGPAKEFAYSQWPLRTGLAASSDPVTFLIKSVMKLSCSSLLHPGAKWWPLPIAPRLNPDVALPLCVKWPQSPDH